MTIYLIFHVTISACSTQLLRFVICLFFSDMDNVGDSLELVEETTDSLSERNDRYCHKELFVRNSDCQESHL